jgi:glycine cleavage system H protein
MSVPAGSVRYSEEHLWFAREAATDGAGADVVVTIGVTERISRILTLVNAVELPAAGTRLEAGAELASIDSQKALIAVAAPVRLEIVAVNGRLSSEPMLVRLDPRGEGWLVRASLGEEAWAALLDVDAYERLVAAEAAR